MAKKFPFFKYHPDPIATGSICPSTEPCTCCKRKRGYIYSGSLYSSYRGEMHLCPWCIADGAAAQHYNGTFNDDHPLLEKQVPAQVIEEVCQRTPGYCSWQQEVWLSHCGDACEFHGDASIHEVHNASEETIGHFLEGQRDDESYWREVLKAYDDNGDLVLYKYICRHCSLTLLGYEHS